MAIRSKFPDPCLVQIKPNLDMTVFQKITIESKLPIYISSVESQKGVIADQRCSVENQKGAIAINFVQQ